MVKYQASSLDRTFAALADATRRALLARLDDLLRGTGLPTLRSEHGLVAPFPAELGHGAWLFTE